MRTLGIWLCGLGLCLGALLSAAPADAQFSIQVSPGGRHSGGGGFSPGRGRGNWLLIEPRQSQNNDPEHQCEEASGQAAVEACTAAYYLDKSNPKNLRRLGDAYLSTGRPNEALGAYSESLRLDPDDDKAQKGRQAALSYLAASRPPGAAPGPAPAYATPAPAPYGTAQPAPAPYGGAPAPGFAAAPPPAAYPSAQPAPANPYGAAPAPGFAAAPPPGPAPVAVTGPAPAVAGNRFDGEWAGTLTPRGEHYVVSAKVVNGQLIIDQDKAGARVNAKGDIDPDTGRMELRGNAGERNARGATELEIKGSFSGNIFRGTGRVGHLWADMQLTRTSAPPPPPVTAVAAAPPQPARQPQVAVVPPAPTPPPQPQAQPQAQPAAAPPAPPPAPARPAAKPAPSTTVAAAPAPLTDKKAPVITAPSKLETDGPVVELSGRVSDNTTIVELSVNGQPISLGANGRFSLRRGVPIGTSELKLAAVDEWGNLGEKTVVVTRAAPAKPTQTASAPPAADAAAAPPPKTADIADQLKGIKFGRYHAVVIGNNEYRYIQKLGTAVQDARAVAGVLKNEYGFQVELLIDVTRAQIMESLYKMRAELTEGDNLLVYYAGHGVQDKDTGRGYWLPVDAQADIPTQWVPTTDLTDVIKAMRAHHILVVADSCFSGTLTRSAAAGLRSAQSENISSWVKRIVAKRSRTVMSSGGLEPVMDGGGEGHSVFAKAFIDSLRDNRDVMDGQSMFAAIRRPIVLNSDQTPEYSDIRQAGHDGGDFLFVRK